MIATEKRNPRELRAQLCKLLDEAWDNYPEQPEEVLRITRLTAYQYRARTYSYDHLFEEFVAVGCELPPQATKPKYWVGSKEFKVRCPFHMTIVGQRDDDPSCSVYPGTKTFSCFGCGAWGDAGNIRTFRHTGKLGNKSDRG